jgi:hypothetical protein
MILSPFQGKPQNKDKNKDYSGFTHIQITNQTYLCVNVLMRFVKKTSCVSPKMDLFP